MGIQVRRLRKLRGMTQRELAARAGVSYRTVQTIEQALAAVRFSTVERVAEALQVSASELTAPGPMNEAEVGRLVREAYQAGRADAIAEVAARLAGLHP